MSSAADDNALAAPEFSPARALSAYLEMMRRRESLDDAPFWKEVAAFNQMPHYQIDQYYGQYVDAEYPGQKTAPRTPAVAYATCSHF